MPARARVLTSGGIGPHGASWVWRRVPAAGRAVASGIKRCASRAA